MPFCEPLAFPFPPFAFVFGSFSLLLLRFVATSLFFSPCGCVQLLLGNLPPQVLPLTSTPPGSTWISGQYFVLLLSVLLSVGGDGGGGGGVDDGCCCCYWWWWWWWAC